MFLILFGFMLAWDFLSIIFERLEFFWIGWNFGLDFGSDFFCSDFFGSDFLSIEVFKLISI